MAAAKTKFTPNKSFRPRLEKNEVKCLAKAGAYVRGVARRKVRVVKNRNKHGAPGEPWKAHDKKTKDAILFEVKPQEKKVVIGPKRFDSGVLNPEGKPVSEVLEHGGVPAAVVNPYWRMRKQLRDAVLSQKDMAKAVMQVYGTSSGSKYYRAAPGFWGENKAAALAARARASKKQFGNLRYGNVSRKGGYGIFAFALNKGVWIAPIKVTTWRQARRVADTIMKTQGWPMVTGKPQAARPLMRISLRAAENNIAKVFKICV